jgi:hypothetical protein
LLSNLVGAAEQKKKGNKASDLAGASIATGVSKKKPVLLRMSARTK